MASTSELKSISKQQRISKIVEERLPSYQVNGKPNYQGKLKVKECTGSANNYPPEDRRRSSDNGSSNRSRTSGNCHGDSFKEKVAKDDELVRYMSKLPGFLQRMDVGESFQGNALNVGVLDWARLEKWKHSQKSAHAAGCNNASSCGINRSEKMEKSSSTFRVVPKDVHSKRTEKHPSMCYNLDSSSNDDISRDLQPSVQKLKRFSGSESASRVPLNEERKAACNHKSSGRNRTEAVPRKSRRTHSNKKVTSGIGSLPSSMETSGFSLSLKETSSAMASEAEKMMEGIQEQVADQKALDQRISSDVGSSSSMSRRHGFSLGLTEKQSARNNDTKKKLERFQDSDGHQKQASQCRKIVILRPKKHTRNTFSEETGKPWDDHLTEAMQNSFFDDVANQSVCSRELPSQIPYSCPLSVDFEDNSESGVMPLGVDHPSDASETSDKRENKLFGSIYSERTETRNHTRTLDQEMSEMESRKSRHPSPNRRFIFSFGRIGRSFSFKEGLSAQESSSTYVSTKSDPVRSDGSACSSGSKLDKPNGHNKARSSPLRRLLDPLLRSKGTETVPPCKGRSTSSNPKLAVGTDELPLQEKQDSSTKQALFQLTVRNGLPLFQFVVDDNSNDILAATVKSSTSSEKDDFNLHCTFYSVNEVKKKKSGSWISHGSKEKHCGFLYNIVGQMRLYNSLSSDLTSQNTDDHSIVKESVLFEVELKHADQAPEKIKPRRELAAVVIKMHGGNISYTIPQEADRSMMQGDGCSWSFEENEGDFSTMIILPGGIHGLPDKGLPSPLIDRWRSGGVCDCGGWDIGCKLRILSNQKHLLCVSTTPKAQLSSNSFLLFDQEGSQQNVAAFKMVPLKSGIFSVEFDSSISLLQAFFICVTVISCERSSDVSGFSNPAEPKAFQEPMVNANDQVKKGPSIIVREMTVKYPPNPPLSPVGRV